MQGGQTPNRKSPWVLSQLAKPGMRLSELWPGKNRFYFEGSCVAGPKEDLCSQLCVLAQVLIIVGLYFGLCAATLAQKASIWLPLSFTLFVLVTITFYFLTHCTDPGNIPRRPFLESGLAAKGKTDPILWHALLFGECKPQAIEDTELGNLQDRNLKKAMRRSRNADSHADEGRKVLM